MSVDEGMLFFMLLRVLCYDEMRSLHAIYSEYARKWKYGFVLIK